jgi:nicotinamidase-related amidase
VSEPYDDTTALIVVDVQNDFADPEGNLYVTSYAGLQIFNPRQMEKFLQSYC